MYGYGFYGFDWTIILLIPAVIFVFIAQNRVNSAYRTYSQIANKKGLTGREVARTILDANDLHDVEIEEISGNLTDNYDPRSRVVHLSQGVADVPSISALSIAAHETGHAIQHGRGYVPLRIRSAIAPVASIVSYLSWPLLIIGLIIITTGSLASVETGNLIFNIGIFCFLGVIVFHAVTLPVEFNASSRALKQMEALGLVDEEEKAGARKVLSAAAMTYVAALAVAVMNLIRILLIRGRR